MGRVGNRGVDINWDASPVSSPARVLIHCGEVNKVNKVKVNKVTLNTLQTLSQPKPWCNDSGVLNLHHGYYTTTMASRKLFRLNSVSRGTNQPIRKSDFVQCMKFE